MSRKSKINLLNELRYVNKGQLNTLEAIEYLTCHPAKILRLDNIIGSLETGKDADFNVFLLKDNEDGTKQYQITSSSGVDLRKKLFETLPKQEIVILELKKNESTLEDAFIKLINHTTEQNENVEPEKDKEMLKKEKEEKKEAKKQEKLKQKQAKKEQKEKNKKGGEK